MIRECFKADTGIMFSIKGLREVGIDPTSLYPLVKPRLPPLSAEGYKIQAIERDYERFAGLSDVLGPKTEEQHELLDALSPIYDQLSLSRSWWILEILPFKHKHQKDDHSWASIHGWNLGRGRYIPRQEHEVRVHRSVKMRIEAEHKNGEKYVPKASFETALASGTLKWVD